MTDTTQAVADPTVAAAPPAAQPDGARTESPADFDTLLAQFDEANPKPAPAPQPEPQQQQPQTSNLDLELVRQEAAMIREARSRKEISELIGRVRGDIPTDVADDDDIENWLNGKAYRDQRVLNAFNQKAFKPKEWAAVESELARQLHAKFSKRIDPQVTEDRMAVAAAVRGQSTSKPPSEPAKDLTRMSNAELRKHTIDQYGFDPGF